MVQLSKEDIEEIADKVRIAVTEEQAEQYAEELTEVMKEVSILNELHTDDVQPTTHGGVNDKSVLRKDEVKQIITQEDALKNAPDEQDGHFRVPSIMD